MVNDVTLVGFLGSDPEVKTVNETQVAKFSLATNKKWKDKNTGEKKEETQWHRIVAWGNLATLCSTYLKKGSKVYIKGEITYRSWEEDDVTKYMTEIKALSVQFLDSKGVEMNTQQPLVNHAPLGFDANEAVPEF